MLPKTLLVVHVGRRVEGYIRFFMEKKAVCSIFFSELEDRYISQKKTYHNERVCILHSGFSKF